MTFVGILEKIDRVITVPHCTLLSSRRCTVGGRGSRCGPSSWSSSSWPFCSYWRYCCWPGWLMMTDPGKKDCIMTSSNGNTSASRALCEGNPSVTDGFPSQRPVVRSFDVFFDLRLNKRLGKQSRRRWVETTLSSLWRHCNGMEMQRGQIPRVVKHHSSIIDLWIPIFHV